MTELITLPRALVRQALEALELAYAGTPAITVHGKAITALKAALEQPEQEPVAWPEGYEPHELPADYTGKLWIEGQVRRLYEASPPRREWRSLSEEEIQRMGNETPGQQGGWNLAFARAIEQALRSKNHE